MPNYLGEMSDKECEATCEKDSECTAYEMSPECWTFKETFKIKGDSIKGVTCYIKLDINQEELTKLCTTQPVNQ